MKKSTLFFKVMVLLALLVPWTSWGQSQLPEGIDENDVIADKIMVLDSNGEIPGDNSGATEEQKGKNVKLETFHFKTGYDYNDWTFVNEVKPSDSGITVKIQGGNTMLSLSGSPKSEVDAIYIKIKNTEGDEKWVRYGFVQSGSSVISASYTTGGDSKVYNGRNISEEEVKVGLKVVSTKYEIGQDNEETTLTTYSVTIPDNAKNVGTYEITITAEGSTATVEYEITKRPVTVTLDGLKLEKGANGTNLNASDYASYFKIEEENNESKSGLVSEEKAKVTGTFDIDTQTVGDASFSTDDLDVVADNSSFASENYTIKWDGKATITKKDFSEGGEGGQGGTIIVTVVDKTYDGKPVDSPVVKDGETSLGKDAYVVEYYQGDTKLESAPIHAGEYKVVITPRETSDYDTESSITKDFTIKAAEITLTGSVTVEQGDELLESYDIKNFDAEKVNVAYEEGSSAIEGLTLTFKAAVTPTKSGSELTQQPSDNVPNAFNVQKTEGDKDDWLITISNAETATYKPGDITIKAITITLIVEAKKVDWTDESNAHAEVTVYVNDKGELKYGEDGYGNSVRISLSDIEALADWEFGSANSVSDEVELSDATLESAFGWQTVGSPTVNVLMITTKSDAEAPTLPATVKVKVNNGESEGYLQISFVEDESTEEPGGDDENMAWADDENKKASIAVYVDKSSGQPLKSEPAMDSKGFAIDLAKFEELEGEWSFATTETNAIIDKDLSALYSFVVFEGDLLLKPQSEFNSESLSSVKVKIENGDNVGYLEINFKTITVIAEDDINKGGDDDNNNDQIDDDETTFVGDATGAKYVIYDGLPHGLGMLEITVDGETKVLKEADGTYDVVYGELEEEPVDAGTYSATITFNEAMGYSGTVTLTNSVVIAQRPITLYFSFEEGILEGEEFVLGENVFIDVKEGSFAEGEKAEFDELIEKGIISAKFALGETQSDGTVEVKLVSFNYPAGEVSGYDLKYSNYDAKILTGHVKEHGEGGTETELPDAGEAGEDGNIDYPGEGEGEVIVGDVDIIDEETGIGGSGINYRQYELKFCETDFFPNLNDYEVEGLKLFSRHNRFYTKANGSFTIWYEKDGVKNGEYGDYRIYISRNGADGDYSELKLDEVSDYFQIRNVNSDIWVRIYYGTGFPVANEEITATDARAYAQANKIVVITPEPTDVQVISMAGAVVATDQVTGQREFANLAEGVYIVRMGETVIKLQVRN